VSIDDRSLKTTLRNLELLQTPILELKRRVDEELEAAGRRKLLIPFVTCGYPTKARTLDLLRACAAGGADRIELGIPWSDPLADGPVIQETSRVALLNGTTMLDAFAIAGRFREAPLLFMTYVNPVLQFGLPRFFSRAKAAGLAGVIIPDLPPEESDEARAAAAMGGVPLVYLCAPTCTDARIRLIDRLSRDFIYLVSVRGVTGARSGVASDLGAFVKRVRKFSKRPLCVGFGISTPADAHRVAAMADGVIVGSAILKRAKNPRDVERFVKSLRKAIDS
jgi:tryptophan synthase alpha chain